MLDKNDLQAIAELIDAKLERFENDITELKRQVELIDSKIENVINPNMLILAEGHSRISGKFNNILTMEQEKRMLMIRLNILEGELENIKNQLTA